MKYLLSNLILIFLFSSNLLAQNESLSFDVGKILGDGKSGRIWSQWRQDIGDRRIGQVTVRARKKTGRANTYLNLRLGNGNALDDGKRVPFPDSELRTISWNGGGQPSKGSPLVLKAYNGQVLIDSVIVEVLPEPVKPEPVPAPEVKRSAPVASSSTGPSAFEVQQNRRKNFDSNEQQGCERRQRLTAPEIEVAQIRQSGGLFSGKRRVSGSIKGACIEEAGYYEEGRLKSSFDIPFQNRFRRNQFEVQITSGKNGEIRVLTYDGTEEVIRVDELISRQNRSRQGGRQTGSSFPF